MTERVEMGPHFDSALAGSPAFLALEGFERDSSERLRWPIKGSEAE
jgi:hypothetical protein